MMFEMAESWGVVKWEMSDTRDAHVNGSSGRRPEQGSAPPATEFEMEVEMRRGNAERRTQGSW